MQKNQNNLQKEAILLLIKSGILFVFLWFIFTIVFGFCKNSGNDMFPMIKNGDLIFYCRLQRSYQNNELIVVEINGEKQIRRIKAVEGDEVSFDETGLLINGYYQQEDTIFKETYAYQNENTYPIKLKKNEWFVLGDNRDEAEDSRVYGPIKTDDIVGSVTVVIRGNNF